MWDLTAVFSVTGETQGFRALIPYNGMIHSIHLITRVEFNLMINFRVLMNSVIPSTGLVCPKVLSFQEETIHLIVLLLASEEEDLVEASDQASFESPLINSIN